MNELNLDQARFNMVEQQIRTWEVLDMKVLDLLKMMPREDFVPEAYRNLAYADIEIPLNGEKMMYPKIEAHLLQALNIQPEDTVLEVGTGSGFVTALLAKLGKHVYSVEINPVLLQQAAEKLKAHGIDNVTLEEGDASQGWDKHAPYDAIAITGGFPEVPEAYKRALKIGGRMFVIAGENGVMEALLITRQGENTWQQQSLFETEIDLLENTQPPPKFEF